MITRAASIVAACVLQAQIAEEALPRARITGPDPEAGRVFKIEYRLRAPGAMPSLPTIPDGLALESSALIPYTIDGGKRAYALLLELVASEPGAYELGPLKDRESGAFLAEAFSFFVGPAGGDRWASPRESRSLAARWSAPERARVGQALNVTLSLPLPLESVQIAAAYAAPEGILLEVEGKGASATWSLSLTPLREGRLALASRAIQTAEGTIAVPELAIIAERAIEAAPSPVPTPIGSKGSDAEPTTIALLSRIASNDGMEAPSTAFYLAAAAALVAAASLLLRSRLRRRRVQWIAIAFLGACAAAALAFALQSGDPFKLLVRRSGAIVDVPSAEGRAVAHVEEGEAIEGLRRAGEYYLVQTDEGIRAWALVDD
jgi:hypothetical protein